MPSIGFGSRVGGRGQTKNAKRRKRRGTKALERPGGFLVENRLAARQETASSLRATCWGALRDHIMAALGIPVRSLIFRLRMLDYHQNKP